MKTVLSKTDIDKIRLARWKARTDLGFLCREVLGYKDVDDYVHGPIMRTLLQFPKPDRKQFSENDVFDGKTWRYTPIFNHIQDIKGKRRRLILAHRGLMKCCGINNLARLADGSYKKIKDLRAGDLIAAQLSETSLEYGYSPITAVEQQPLQPGYKITFRSGRELILSHQHPLRLIQGWAEAKDIVVGDRVAVQAHVPEPPNAPNIPDAELVGWFLGDGCCMASNITNVDPSIQARIVALCESIGCSATVRHYKNRAARISVTGYRPRLRELGISESRSGDKFIPEEFFKADNASVSKLLYGLFMSDGTMGKTQCFLTTKSRRLADDTQRLLLRFNVWSVVRPSYVKYKGEMRTYWVCRITSSPMIQRFIDAIGWDKLNRFEYKHSNPNTNTVPREWRDSYGKTFFARGERPEGLSLNFNIYDISKDKLRRLAEALDDDKLRFLTTDAIIWDFVEKVEFLGDIETIAIETESKTLAVEDVVTHNTTLNLQAHSIQWIINYPSVAMAIFQSNLDKSEDILKSIRHHFRYNETFRRLFPEHCPQTRIEEWGLKSEFTTMARPRSESRREPTMKALSIDKENAGYHFDVMKFSDIVEPGTTKTDDAMANTEREFSLAESLLVSPVYWIDVEGTRYTSKEMYQKIIDKWLLEHKKGYEHEYDILIQGCFKLKDPRTGLEQTVFTPDTLEWPDLLDENNLQIPWWPHDASGAERYPLRVLLEKQRNDPYDFSCQYLIKPQSGIDGRETFPTDKLQKISVENFRKNVAPRIQYYTIGLDTAQSDKKRSNYSAFVVCAWDAANRAYVVDIVRKKLLPNQLVDEIFRLNEQYRPKSFVIEETNFVTGLRVGIETELTKRRPRYRQNRIPWNIDYIRPENDKSKEARIKNTLQPVIEAGNLRVVVPSYDAKSPGYSEEAVDTFEAMLKEFKTFPDGATDDILDALADQFQPKSYFGRLAPRALTDVTQSEMKAQFERFLNIEPSYDNNKPFPTRHEGFIPPQYFK